MRECEMDVSGFGHALSEVRWFVHGIVESITSRQFKLGFRWPDPDLKASQLRDLKNRASGSSALTPYSLDALPAMVLGSHRDIRIHYILLSKSRIQSLPCLASESP
jgi:hypothetical protein